jgi:Mn2+/Fe2+ NRAMP family transporter
MKKNSAILGAAFLMATSAIGPGFLTQTSLFTGTLLASFGFVILVSILLDIGAQLNIWRVVTMSALPAQDIANKVAPGAGYFLAALIAFGGLVFNVGNIAGTGMGLHILTGLPPAAGAAISCVIAVLIFRSRQAGKIIDIMVRVLGLIMIVLTLYVAISSRPPLGEALYRSVFPEKIDFLTIVTVVGGTVGGYISFAGAHRLIDAGITGKHNLQSVSRSAVSGILVTSLMRFVLFLAALGVVSKGVQLAADNPAASVFESALGTIGFKFFGLVLWIAAITSVIGASYTSVSFWKTLSPAVHNNNRLITTLFIVVCTLLFFVDPRPVKLLVLAGAVNGIILPVALALILIAARKRKILQDYRHPIGLQLAGWLVVAIMGAMGAQLIVKGLASFW